MGVLLMSKFEPLLEKFVHPHGTEYVWVYDGKIFGRVEPVGTNKAGRKVWRCCIGNKSIAIYTGKNGRALGITNTKFLSEQLIAKEFGK
jgi:hypothetical protein